MVEGSRREGSSILRDTYLLEILFGVYFALWISVNILGENSILHSYCGLIKLLIWPLLFLYCIAKAIWREKEPNYLYNMCAILGSVFVAVILFFLLNTLFYPPVNPDLVDSTPTIINEAGVPLVINNSERAQLQSWATVRDFILQDHTVENKYIYPNFSSANYAVEVHNNAERAGIKSSIAKISISEWNPNFKVWKKEQYHYINAFETTDHGRVFIDCTNEGDGVPNIAYVKLGDNYGLLSIKDVENPYYSYYDEVQMNWYNYTNYKGAVEMLPRFESQLKNSSEYYKGKTIPKFAQDDMDFYNKTIKKQRAMIQSYEAHPEWYDDHYLYDELNIAVLDFEILY